MPHVILIEDDALVRTLLQRRMVAAGWEVTALRDGRDLEESLREKAADLVVLDLGLPYMDGLSLLELLRAQGSDVPVMVLTGYDLPHLHEAVIGAGADALVQKPYDPEDLVQRMQHMVAA